MLQRSKICTARAYLANVAAAQHYEFGRCFDVEWLSEVRRLTGCRSREGR